MLKLFAKDKGCLIMYSMTALKHIKIYSVKPDINDFLVFSFKLWETYL